MTNSRLVNLVFTPLLACAGLTAWAQAGDHRQLTQAIETLSQDINRYTDQLLDFDFRAKRLRTSLAAERQQVADSFMTMQRLALSPRPSILFDPGKALNTARAQAILRQVRPDLTLKQSGTLAPLNTLNVLESNRSEVFDTLTKAEAQYDTLSVALAKLNSNGSLDAALTGIAEGTYLTAFDKGLDQNATIAESRDLALRAHTRPTDLRDMTKQDGFVLPVLQAEVVSDFDNQDIGLQFRQGLVIQVNDSGAIATNALAPFDGQVIFSEPLRGYGPTLILRHNDNLVSILVGLGDVSVKLGQWLYQGDAMGTISTPNGQRARLFWQVRQGNRLIDPAARLR